MITKGIIKGKVLDSNKYFVQIPYLEQSSVSNNGVTESVLEATLSHTPGVINSYNDGDTVFVSFEESRLDKPVILGKLLLDENSNRGYANFESLKVTNSVDLSGNVTISGTDFENILSTLEEIKFKFESIQEKITADVVVADEVDATTANINTLNVSNSLTLPNSSITTSAINSKAVTTSKIADKAVTKRTIDYDDIYPVGSIYMSINSTNPSTLFGGTWERIEGKFLLGVMDDVQTTEKDNLGYIWSNESSGNYYYWKDKESDSSSHRINTADITGGNVNQSHGMWSGYAQLFGSTPNAEVYYQEVNSGDIQGIRTYADTAIKVSSVTGKSVSDTYGTALGGFTNEASNMPPYLTVYMWKRVS